MNKYDVQHVKLALRPYAMSEGTEQPVHSNNLIRASFVCQFTLQYPLILKEDGEGLVRLTWHAV